MHNEPAVKLKIAAIQFSMTILELQSYNKGYAVYLHKPLLTDGKTTALLFFLFVLLQRG